MEILNNEIYPALYSQIGRALPEFKFKKTAGGYISTTDVKITGDKGKTGKVYIYDNNISHLIDYTKGSISLWDYIQERDKLTSKKEVLYKLAELSGVKLPNGEFDTEAYSKAKRQAQIWEDVNSYLMNSLETSKNKEAEDLRKYLKKRAYSPEDIKAMELGYIDSQAKLKANLKSKGYTPEDIETIKLNEAIGNTHTLTIPLREPVGDIIGLTVRNINHKDTDNKIGKYLNSTGLTKTDKLFNLRAIIGKKDLIIVEGLLDCLLASARGIDNVVSLGGKGFNKAQLETAIKHGAQKITLCYDNEEATIPNILKAIDLIKDNSELKIYVAQLPEGVKDPDELIRKQGAEAFKKVIDEAIGYSEYILQNIISKYAKLLDETGGLSAKDEDEFLEEIVSTASKIQEPIEREMFTKTFLSIEEIEELGISKASLDETVEKIKYKKDKVIQKAKLKALLDEIKDLQDKGDTEKAISKIETGLPDIKAISGSGLLPPALSYSTLIEGIGNLPPAFKTGYRVLDKFVGFTTGAITLIAGRPSHGKTTLMFNLLLQMSQVYQKENYKFYFFTYEEPITNIVVKLINRLADTDLSQYYNNYNDIHTNYEFIKAYIKDKREDIKKIEEAKESLRILIDEKHISLIDRSYSVEDLSKLIAYLTKREKIGAVFIDYIQRMNTERKTQDIRTQIAHISDQVLKIAKDNNLPIILGAQLNRATTGNKNKKPILENLKEAGNLEEDANTVISVYNESRENEEDPEGKTFEGKREVELEIKTLKNREGEVNKKALLTFDKWTGVIKNYSKDF